MPRSPLQSQRDLENIKKALPWRSPDEARLVRMFIWKYLLGHGPQCTPFALARWLGVQESFVRLLRKKLPLNQAAFDQAAKQNGAPTLAALAAARQKSRQMRKQGLLRTQPLWKKVTDPATPYARPKFIPAKPNAVTLVLNGMIPLQPPGPDQPKRRGGWPKKKKRPWTRRSTGCSRKQALENLKKGKEPRRWRSRSEARLVRMFVWQWALRRGPNCSQCALARWLGISDAHLRALKKKLLAGLSPDHPFAQAEFTREIGRCGIPTLDALSRARDESRWMRGENLLRTQRAYKTIKCGEYNGIASFEMICTKPNNVTLALDGVTPLQPPTKLGPHQAPPDEFSTHMWLLRMHQEAANKAKPILPRRSRPGCRR